MGYKPGEPIKGILTSADASSGVAIPIFSQGSNTARTLGDDEYLVIHSVELVSTTAGDAYVFLGADATLGTGETVERGDFAANGGIAPGFDLEHAGALGHTPFVVAPGAVDVKLTGRIRKKSIGERPNWREDQSPPAA